MSNSRVIDSVQKSPHQNLSKAVLKHLQNPWKKPVSAHTQAAFDHAMTACPEGQPLILDSGCGTAQSTRVLAQRYPDHFIMGVDRSQDRLSRQHQVPLPDNALLVRAELADFWRCLVKANIRAEKHYLLYPNPYPKSSDLKLRWHGHPVFPDLLKISPILEVRSNWQMYLIELEKAAQMVDSTLSSCLECIECEDLTRFETKYASSGQDLWRLTLNECKL